MNERAGPGSSAAPLGLRHNLAWTLAGNVVYVACQWGMLVSLAKLGDPSMVGQFALGLAVSAPIVMFGNLQLRALLATDTERRFGFGDYLFLRMLTGTLSVLVVAAIGLLVYRGPTRWVLVAVGVAKGVESISDVFYGLLQQHERMDRIAVSQALRGVLALAAFAVVVRTTGSVVWACVALAACWSVLLVAVDVRNGGWILRGAPDRRLLRAPRRGAIPRLLRLGLPLGVVMLLISANANVPRYVVKQALGASALGIFAALAYLAQGGAMIVDVLGQAASPRLARHAADGDGRFGRLLAWVLAAAAALGAAGVLIAWMLGRPLLTLLYTADYAEHAPVLVWLMVAAAAAYLASMLGHAATASRRIRHQPVALALVVVVTTTLCYVLVPEHGLVGAAWAVLSGAATSLVAYGLIMLGPRG